MKIQQIRKLILENKKCVILTSNMKTQWIGGKDWIARVDDGLKITAESIKGLFDLSVEQMEKFQVVEEPVEGYPLWPVARRDMNVMKPGMLEIGNYGGIVILTYQNAVYLVEKRYIKAMVSNDDYREYILGWDEGNNPVILVNDGYIKAGIVRPMPVMACETLMGMMQALVGMEPGGTHAPENGGPLKLEAEGGQQLDMSDFPVEDEKHADD